MLQTITITQIQRNPAILTDFDKNQDYKIILKHGRQAGAVVKVELLNKLLGVGDNSKSRKFQLSDSIVNKLKRLDPVKFQNDLRNE